MQRNLVPGAVAPPPLPPRVCEGVVFQSVSVHHLPFFPNKCSIMLYPCVGPLTMSQPCLRPTRVLDLGCFGFVFLVWWRVNVFRRNARVIFGWQAFVRAMRSAVLLGLWCFCSAYCCGCCCGCFCCHRTPQAIMRQGFAMIPPGPVCRSREESSAIVEGDTLSSTPSTPPPPLTPDQPIPVLSSSGAAGAGAEAGECTQGQTESAATLEEEAQARGCATSSRACLPDAQGRAGPLMAAVLSSGKFILCFSPASNKCLGYIYVRIRSPPGALICFLLPGAPHPTSAASASHIDSNLSTTGPAFALMNDRALKVVV